AVERGHVTSQLQYDYLTAYAAFYEGEVESAGAIAEDYEDYPIEKWRERFQNVARQVAEVEGEAGRNEGREREQLLEQISATEPRLEIESEGREIAIRHRNVEEVQVNYYEMDLEFLFSSQPFVSGEIGQFSFIRPNLSETREVGDGGVLDLPVPDRFQSRNVLIEVVAEGKRDSVAVYANQLDLRLAEGAGRLEVRHRDTGSPLPQAYIKVYARMKDGAIRFFKDGYTDLRGKFDFTSLSTNELDQVDRLSLLVMSEEHGSLVREAKPPQR
ncbi:MAG: hypothetical protein AAGC68_06860, partial [Verrucomicrobiota bacterium]